MAKINFLKNTLTLVSVKRVDKNRKFNIPKSNFFQIMIHTYNYGSVSKALQELKELGFVIDFNINNSEFKSNPHDFEIVHIYRYEGDSNPDDEATVYGIKSKSGKKGVFVSGYAANSESDSARFLIGLSIKSRKGL
ncbi:hypothetical protein FLJC2902T_21210 [Flavobacterium limnosediminis JC2902]|uniref:Uncharacterized protein n=2 Tax=Flavobacterium TaxID=237 RepID=V6SRW9_9FLAO|nr:hypothetical protein FLJC2902T_21210 [Flavobacterium limnosediminis JC2902]